MVGDIEGHIKGDIKKMLDLLSYSVKPDNQQSELGV